MTQPRAIDLAFLYILLITGTLSAQANNIGRDSSDPNPDVSNGTCYYGPGQIADSSYIPCGNTAFGTFACCEASSVCLENNACYLESAETTYVAGCTDPSYSDPSCPIKGPYNNQQWAGLVYCNGTSDQWTLCDESSADSNLVVAVPGCYCPEDEVSRSIAFNASSVIANEVSLPASIGQLMSFFNGYNPSIVLTYTTTTISDSTSTRNSSNVSGSSSSNVNPAPITSVTSTSSPASSSSSLISQPGRAPSKSGLSTGEKAGIGIAAVLGGCMLLALIGCIAVYIRRRKQRREEAALRPRSEMSVAEKDQFDQRGLAWSDRISELPGDEGNSKSMASPASVQQSWSRPLSEVEGSVPTYQSIGSLRSQELADSRPVYQPYRRAEVPPIGAELPDASSTASQVPYSPIRQVEDGVYEMPAQLPGSVLP